MLLAPKSWVPIFKSGASLTNAQVCDPPGRSITCIPGCTMDSTGPVAWCSPTSDGGYCPWKPVSPPGLNDYKNVKFILCKYALARASCSKSVYTCANSLSWHTDVHFLWGVLHVVLRGISRGWSQSMWTKASAESTFHTTRRDSHSDRKVGVDA